MTSWLGRQLGRVLGTRAGRTQPAPREAPAPGSRAHLRGRFESAETNRENEPLWRFTDYLSAKSANSFGVRKTLKIRSRYEACNNSYFRGIIDTMANDLVGTGPRLQVRTKNAAVNRRVQDAWHNWAKAIGLANKLRVMAKAKIQDGEAFALLVTNRKLRATFGGSLNVSTPVQLDVVVIESDQVTTPDPGFVDQFWVDGMVLDALGKPVEYHVLRTHPGDYFNPQLNPLKYDKWAPGYVLHWFRQDRPGQVRGVPEITPALDLFAQLRRYTKAVIQAAETAADIVAMMETQAPANVDLAEPEPGDVIHFKRGEMVTLPWGSKLSQLKAEQPTTTYEMFVRVLLREICRCLNIPLSMALGDASNSNFSSARMEHLGYHRSQRVDRQLCADHALDNMFAAFIDEAVMVEGLLPDEITSAEQLPHRWFWDSAESINPIDDARAEECRLEAGTETLTGIYAERGEDWETAITQRANEIALCYKLAAQLNIPVEHLLPKTTASVQLKKTEDDPNRDADEKPASGKGKADERSKVPAA